MSTENNAAPLLATRSLFRFAVPCRRREKLWTPEARLDESYRLVNLGDLDGDLRLAEMRAAWNETGLVFACHVSGKLQLPWCRESRPDNSDGLRVYIDTRDTHNIHRASRFCHAFIFMPAGTGRGLDEPVAEQLLINRARENAKPIRPGVLGVHRTKRVDGYVLEGFVPASAMTGFDPAEHPKLGFTYALVDRELGEQSFSSPIDVPYREDPSLWATLELVS